MNMLDNEMIGSPQPLLNRALTRGGVANFTDSVVARSDVEDTREILWFASMARMYAVTASWMLRMGLQMEGC